MKVQVHDHDINHGGGVGGGYLLPLGMLNDFNTISRMALRS